ncbi:Abortive infection protein [Deinococcus proteolyticus MRP]|uniref:Abortive infection protein n=1 Tax=Deinococcus proteolyticus (strain ATCC 35074 / DSM 20540 / JCM 6276 / NBRC 101906 / NCIMB 13154 / VKM Ac-1939 / CCM 2703 / MRP) TaxID=693977 RepID=F0RK37_DEIPM|nr:MULTISPECIES: CPBP family intramembrane glutamic endopeptidase [Deinococcus]ADY26683.1 Abortive infection protein [Deinococcus proteolyticus MRP]MCY1702811.1 CPBP family intramembrane metalloprotease [Deinococcus sp. SL84]
MTLPGTDTDRPAAPPPAPPAWLPAPLRRWQAAYARSGPLGKTLRELGLAYLGYVLLLPLTLLVPELAMSEDNAAGIDSVFQDALGGTNPYLALAGAALLLTVVVPVTEELIFRGIPLLLRLGLLRVVPPGWARGLSLGIGLVSAVVFASVHNLMPGTLPLPQLWLGLLTWHAASTRGLRYSMLLHGLNNAVVVSLFILMMLVLGPQALQGAPAGDVPLPPLPVPAAAH